MTAAAALAISGSNLTGEYGFSCCLETAAGRALAHPAPGQRSDLAALVRDLLAAGGVTPAGLDTLRIDLGPGSYTGLRVAVTFARFLQHFGGLEVLACDSLMLLASTAPRRHGRLRPLLDARRHRFHCGTLAERDGVLQHLAEPAAMTLDDVVASIATDDVFVVPAATPEPVLAALRARAAEVVRADGITAEALFSQRLAMQRCTPAQLEPRYLMASYAE